MNEVDAQLLKLNVKNKHGIYAFLGCRGDEESLLYVGKSGQVAHAVHAGPKSVNWKGSGLEMRLSKGQSGLPDWWTSRLGIGVGTETEHEEHDRNAIHVEGQWTTKDEQLSELLYDLGFSNMKNGQLKRSVFLPLLADVCGFDKVIVRVWLSHDDVLDGDQPAKCLPKYAHPALLEALMITGYLSETRRLPTFHSSF